MCAGHNGPAGPVCMAEMMVLVDHCVVGTIVLGSGGRVCSGHDGPAGPGCAGDGGPPGPDCGGNDCSGSRVYGRECGPASFSFLNNFLCPVGVTNTNVISLFYNQGILVSNANITGFVCVFVYVCRLADNLIYKSHWR